MIIRVMTEAMRLAVPARFMLVACLGMVLVSFGGTASGAGRHRAGDMMPPGADREIGDEASYTSGPPAIYRSGNLRILFRSIQTDQPFDRYIVTIARPGRRPVVLRFEASRPGCCTIAVGELDRSGARYVMIRAVSGGPHCCSEQYVVAPDVRRPRALYLGGFDIEPESVDETRDVDGDGRIDFVRSDDRFNGRFTWGMASAIPPQIWNVVDGHLVDVSLRPRYRSFFRRYMASVRPTCLQGDHNFRNSACAAYVATAARIGAFAPAWRLMLGAYHRDDIREGRTFPRRLRTLLINRHYIRRRERIPPAVV